MVKSFHCHFCQKSLFKSNEAPNIPKVREISGNPGIFLNSENKFLPEVKVWGLKAHLRYVEFKL